MDFVANDMETAIEAKASQKITSDQLRGLRNLLQDHGRADATLEYVPSRKALDEGRRRHVRRRIVVSLEKKPRRTDDGIEILVRAAFPTGET